MNDKEKPELLINPARNNPNGFGGFVSTKTFQLAIIRDPVKHFRSIYELSGANRYMRSLYLNETDARNFIEFTRKPLWNIDRILNFTKRFEPALHLLKNRKF